MPNNAPSVKSEKSSNSTVIKTVLAILAIQAIAAGLFYAGYNYKATQDAKTKAAVQDALKTIQTPAAVADASPKN
jgi:uncharacterized protein HemX